MIDSYKNKLFRLLRWTEKYTKTDMVYLASGGFWLFLKTGATMLIAFAVSVAFANLLPKTTYGEYKYIFSMFGLLAIPTLTGMGTATTKSIAQGYDGDFITAFKAKVRWGVIGSIAGASVGIYYAIQGNMELAGAFALVALFLPFVDTLSIYNSVLTGKKLFKISTIYEVIIQAFAAVVIIVTLFLTNNLIFVLASYFVSYTVIRFVFFHIITKRHITNNKIDAATTRYGKHLSAMGILGTVSEAVDSILLWQFIGPAQVAVYAFAKGIPVQLSGALQRIMTLAFPKFAQRDFQTIHTTIIHKMLLMLLVTVVIVGAYVVAAPYIFKFFFPAYTDAIIFSQFFALSLLFFPLKFLGVVFQAHGQTKPLYVHTSVTSIMRIILSVLLVPLFGIWGLITSELLTRLVGGLLISVLFLRKISEPGDNLL